MNNFPYDEMSDLGWVAETSEQRERVINLRKYFEVYQLSIVKERRISIGVDSKREFSSNEEFYSVVAWTQKARLEARIMSSNIEMANQLANIDDLTLP